MASKLFKNYSKLVGNEMAKLIDETPLSSDPQRFYDTGSYMMNAHTGDFFKGVQKEKLHRLLGMLNTVRHSLLFLLSRTFSMNIKTVM